MFCLPHLCVFPNFGTKKKSNLNDDQRSFSDFCLIQIALFWSHCLSLESKVCQLSDIITYNYKCHCKCWDEHCDWIQNDCVKWEDKSQALTEGQGFKKLSYLIIYSKSKNKSTKTLGIGWPLWICSRRRHWLMRFLKMQMWVSSNSLWFVPCFIFLLYGKHHTCLKVWPYLDLKDSCEKNGEMNSDND